MKMLDPNAGAAEAIFAAMKLRKILAKRPAPLTPKIVDAAEELPRQIEREARAAIEGKSAQPSEQPDIPWKDVIEMLSTSSPISIAEQAEASPVPGLADVTDRAVAYLRTLIPTRTVTTVFEVRPADPTWQEQDRMGLALMIAEDPLTALRDLRAGVLCNGHIAAMAAIYPELYKHAVSSLYIAAGESAADSPIEMSWAQEKQFRLFLGGAPNPDIARETTELIKQDLPSEYDTGSALNMAPTVQQDPELPAQQQAQELPTLQSI